MGKVKKAKVKETILLSCLSHNFTYHLFFKKSQWLWRSWLWVSFAGTGREPRMSCSSSRFSRAISFIGSGDHASCIPVMIS